MCYSTRKFYGSNACFATKLKVKAVQFQPIDKIINKPEFLKHKTFVYGREGQNLCLYKHKELYAVLGKQEKRVTTRANVKKKLELDTSCFDRPINLMVRRTSVNTMPRYCQNLLDLCEGKEYGRDTR